MVGLAASFLGNPVAAVGRPFFVILFLSSVATASNMGLRTYVERLQVRAAASAAAAAAAATAAAAAAAPKKRE